MPSRIFAGARFTLPVVLLAGLGLVFAWPLGLAVVAYALWGERFGWRPRVEAFLSGFGRGLREGSCRCGPTVFFFEPGREGCDVAEARRRIALPADDRAGR